MKKKTRQVRAGTLAIGGGASVSIQSMTNIPLDNVAGTIGQIRRLAESGAELVRVAVRSEDQVQFLKKVIESVSIPVAADVHFNHKIAIAAIHAGAHKIRINPGNIGKSDRVREVVRAAADFGVPIRIGVNGGSIDRKKYPEVTPENLVASALEHVKNIEDAGFRDIVISIKSSDIRQTIEANKILSSKVEYPLHIGLTEAGYGLTCTVQSSAAIGHLLLSGIGDTIRVSMTGDPVREVAVAKKILEACGERVPPIRIISCPTCGRTDPSLDLEALAGEVEAELVRHYEAILREKGKTVTVAVMGCEVNGPGEASHADAGVAGIGRGEMLLFARGEKLGMIASADAVKALCGEIEKILE